MARITKLAVMRAVDLGIDAFVKALNSELEKSDPAQKTLLQPPESDEGKIISQLIAFYIKSYQHRINPKARPDIGAKAQGVLKRLLRDYSQHQIASLIGVYLQMDDQWFKTKCYDLVTLEMNIQKVLFAATTGRKGVQESTAEKAAKIIESREKPGIT